MKNSFKITNSLIITLGAIPAALLRWQLADILMVNLIGCFLIGLINALTINQKYKLLFGFGFCGSLTTYSGWMDYLFELLNDGFYKEFFISSISTVVFGFSAISFGYLLAKKVID